jgi:starvation-inducible DNA-binding protein
MATPSIALPGNNAKSVVIDILNARLADAIDLSLMIKQAHWNLKGLQFIGVHEMLDTFRTAVDQHVDTIAERVAQLDGIAMGTTQAVASASKLAPYPTEIRKVPDHLQALGERYTTIANQVREDINATADAGDEDASDILTAFSRELDKELWFIKSHLE